jgi:hypothetical protein
VNSHANRICHGTNLSYEKEAVGHEAAAVLIFVGGGGDVTPGGLITLKTIGRLRKQASFF